MKPHSRKGNRSVRRAEEPPRRQNELRRPHRRPITRRRAQLLPRRRLLKDDLHKPIIGIANTWTEVGPCNFHLRQVAEAVKEGIREAGGTPMEFNTITVHDGITMGTEGMKASLISREVIADSIELVTRANSFDGLVCIAGCDKNMPAAIMALARLNIPGLMLYGGSIAPGNLRQPDGSNKEITILSVFEAIGSHAAGRINDDQLEAVEAAACPGPGACGGQFTANTMAMAGEFLGISPIQLSGVPAMSKEKHAASPRSRPHGHGARAQADQAARHPLARRDRKRHRRGCRIRRQHQRRAPPDRHRARAQHSTLDGRLRPDLRAHALHLRPLARRQVRREGLPGGRRLAPPRAAA